MIKSQFQSQFYPFENLVIDESMILFKGRLSFKQYIKTKKHRFGIKLYVLCDCETGFVLDFLVYIGKNTDVTLIENLGSSGSVVVKLLEPHLNKGHTFYSDNYYTSPLLSTYLYNHKTNSCGTVRQNRKHMPEFKKKLKRGEIDWKSSANLLALKWKDRRDVVMLTTFHENEVITLEKIDRVTQELQKKPLCVIDYNGQMGAIDRSDMMISSVDCTRKTVKWYKKLFFHTLDLCILNAHALYCTQNAKRVPFPKFRLEVIRQIMERYPVENSRTSRPDVGIARLIGRHYPEEIPRKQGKLQRRRCIVCAQTKNTEKKRKETRFICKDCDVGLCIPCFRIYHEEKNF